MNSPRLSKRARSLTPSDISECREFFKRMDFNHNGTVGIEDLRKALDTLGLHPTEKEAESIIKGMRLSQKRGSLDEEDFMMFMEARMEDRRRSSANHAELIHAFNVFDDGDGCVPIQSLTKVFKNFGFELDLEELDEVLADLHMQPQKSGKLTLEEFLKLMGP